MSTDRLPILYKKTAADGAQMTGLTGHALLADMRIATESQGTAGALAIVAAILIVVLQRMSDEDQKAIMAELGWEPVARVDMASMVSF